MFSHLSNFRVVIGALALLIVVGIAAAVKALPDNNKSDTKALVKYNRQHPLPLPMKTQCELWPKPITICFQPPPRIKRNCKLLCYSNLILRTVPTCYFLFKSGDAKHSITTAGSIEATIIAQLAQTHPNAPHFRPSTAPVAATTDISTSIHAIKFEPILINTPALASGLNTLRLNLNYHLCTSHLRLCHIFIIALFK